MDGMKRRYFVIICYNPSDLNNPYKQIDCREGRCPLLRKQQECRNILDSAHLYKNIPIDYMDVSTLLLLMSTVTISSEFNWPSIKKLTLKRSSFKHTSNQSRCGNLSSLKYIYLSHSDVNLIELFKYCVNKSVNLKIYRLRTPIDINFIRYLQPQCNITIMYSDIINPIYHSSSDFIEASNKHTFDIVLNKNCLCTDNWLIHINNLPNNSVKCTGNYREVNLNELCLHSHTYKSKFITFIYITTGTIAFITIATAFAAAIRTESVLQDYNQIEFTSTNTIDQLKMAGSDDIRIVKKYRFLLSVRFLVAVMACLCLAIQYAQRMNLTIAIVRMVNKTAVSGKSPSLTNSSTLSQDGPFIWNKPKQGQLLSAYFFGYIAFQVGGGIMAYKFGPYKVLLSAMIMGTTTTFLTPSAAKFSFAVVLILRFLTGLSASVVWPAMVELSSRWSPKDEKSIIMAIGNSGAQIGPLISMPLFGALCTLDALGGWPLVFYASGLMGVAWCALFILTITSNPSDNKLISEREKIYIQQNVVVKVVGKQTKIPVKKIFTAVPCIAMFASHFFKAFGFYTILTNVSTYNEEILGLDIKTSGYLTAIPYLVYFVCTIGSGKAADLLIRKQILEAGICRKVFTGIGSFGPALTVFALGFVNKSTAWAGILLISLTLGFLGCNSGGGMYIVAQDMAPKYAGIIWGISNTFGTAPGIIVPLIIGMITKKGTQMEWRIVFTICAVSYIISGLAFVIFGSGKPLPWAVNTEPSELDKSEVPDVLSLNTELDEKNR
ncbi:hypothetical protein GJ496_000639 [Pomphorhynchus laevis]|nr:hypothetical protein GJ496_000639 [Pomphorhynchus laevis]